MKTIMRDNSFSSKSRIVKATSALALATILIAPMASGTSSEFNDGASAKLTVKADVLGAPTNINVANNRVNETDLSWIASKSVYATGYTIYRSEKISGPWIKIGTNTGRTKVTFTDTASGSKSYYYKVDAIYKEWVSSVVSFIAPPAVGRTFFDSFDGAPGNLDGRTTEDGLSKWLVWSGNMYTADVNPLNNPAAPFGFGAFGTMPEPPLESGKTPSPGNGDVAVVRTPVNDAWVFAADFDGFERVILRGKDPANYIYAGGRTVMKSNGSLAVGNFEIAEVRNGVKTTLATSAPGSDKDFRIEIRGDSIKAYIDATKNDPNSGTLHLEATSSFQQTDPLATYFGIGFNRGGYGINDFTFQAY